MKMSRGFEDFKNEYDELVEYYDGIAEGYDELHFEEQKEKFALLAEYMSVGETAKVLDVGCGTFFSYDVFTKVLGWDVYGIEPSSKMVSLFVKTHSSHKSKIQIGFAEELGEFYGRDQFDAVICVSVAHHFKDPSIAFEEMKRVCKPGGVIAVTVLNGVSNFRKLLAEIESSFTVEQRIESKKDTIFICRDVD
ncbi:MAG: class I SAM-dependent methyltransferase [Candidatus Nanoarchaeia archaeon]